LQFVTRHTRGFIRGARPRGAAALGARRIYRLDHFREKIVQTALKNRLPGSYPYREWVTAGGLLSYGPKLTTILYGAVPNMVDTILKGTKPGDIPAEQPKLELFINLKTAKILGLDLPNSLLARADEVIE